MKKELTDKEKASALYEAIDVEILDELVPFMMKDALDNSPDDDMIEHIKAVHNYFCLPGDMI